VGGVEEAAAVRGVEEEAAAVRGVEEAAAVTWYYSLQ